MSFKGIFVTFNYTNSKIVIIIGMLAWLHDQYYQGFLIKSEKKLFKVMVEKYTSKKMYMSNMDWMLIYINILNIKETPNLWLQLNISNQVNLQLIQVCLVYIVFIWKNIYLVCISLCSTKRYYNINSSPIFLLPVCVDSFNVLVCCISWKALRSGATNDELET